jgi:hypothetical protein
VSAAGSGRMPVPAVSVDEEQRRRLIECCAFFRALRFREVAPGRYRREDLDSAACAIDTVIQAAGKRKKQ